MSSILLFHFWFCRYDVASPCQQVVRQTLPQGLCIWIMRVACVISALQWIKTNFVQYREHLLPYSILYRFSTQWLLPCTNLLWPLTEQTKTCSAIIFSSAIFWIFLFSYFFNARSGSQTAFQKSRVLFNLQHIQSYLMSQFGH